MHLGQVTGMSSEAARSGVRLGMRAGGVSAISPDTFMLERSVEKEQLALSAICMALLQYTPEVVHADDFSVLMDVTASLTLFDGPLTICRRVCASIAGLGFTARLGAAPTAMGAWLLARCAQTRGQPVRRRVLKMRTLSRRLDRLPCHLLPATKAYQDWLTGIGAQNLASLRRLPRAGLLRRTNKQVLEELDRAYGQAPELFQWIKVPLTFSQRIETFDRIEHADALLFGAKRLILQLVGWLVSLQQAVRKFTLILEHERGRAAIPPTELDIALAEPAWHEEHLVRLLKERLGKVELAAPVIALRLEAKQLVPMVPPTQSLFPEPGGSPADFYRLLELLTARLGNENVLAPVSMQDYRPEVCNAWAPATDKSAKEDGQGEVLERPFWLLPKPIALLMRNDRPFYGAPLKLIQGPERVEAGWWDDQTAARDYFVAQAADASCYWIYLERTSEARWFLHGLYA
ncbi:MAG: DNA polymerase Y family protein [Burkholderiaceae bacterium]